MKLLLFVISLLLPQLAAADEPVALKAEVQKVEAKGWILRAELKNQSDQGIFVPKVGGRWIELRMDMWCSGRGVELYTPDDAERRRRLAFVDYEWVLLKPGENIKVEILLKDMKPANPQNDGLSSEVMSDFHKRTNRRAFLDAMIRVGSAASSDENRFVAVEIIK